MTSTAASYGIAQRRGEDAEERLLEAPQRRVVVERVGHRGEARQRVRERDRHGRRRLRQLELAGGGGVRGQGRLAAGAGEHAQPPAAQRAERARRLERLEHRRDRCRAGHAETVEERVVELVGAGQRAGMRGGDAAPELRRAGLDHADRHAALAGAVGRGGEQGHVAQPLEVDADAGHLGLVAERVHDTRHVDLGLVAHRDDERDGHAALVHRHVDAEVAALQHHRDAPVGRRAGVRHGPEADAVDAVDQPVAVRAEDRQVPGRRHQLVLERHVARLGEAGRVADGPARAHGRELADDPDRRLGRRGDEGRIRCRGKVCDGGHRRHAGQLRARGVDGVDRSGEAGVAADRERLRGQRAADERDAGRSQEAEEPSALGHARGRGCGR